jgi:hypothetical protein
VRIIYFNEESYLVWLGDRDSHTAMISAWAVEVADAENHKTRA